MADVLTGVITPTVTVDVDWHGADGVALVAMRPDYTPEDWAEAHAELLPYLRVGIHGPYILADGEAEGAYVNAAGDVCVAVPVHRTILGAL